MGFATLSDFGVASGDLDGLQIDHEIENGGNAHGSEIETGGSDNLNFTHSGVISLKFYIPLYLMHRKSLSIKSLVSFCRKTSSCSLQIDFNSFSLRSFLVIRATTYLDNEVGSASQIGLSVLVSHVFRASLFSITTVISKKLFSYR